MKQYLLIGLGGTVGAISRYSISIIFASNSFKYPFATLIVNLIGCFLLTFLLNFTKIKQLFSTSLFTALSVGVIGSFTTFSTVTIEIVDLWKLNTMLAIIYTITSIFGGLACCIMGYTLAKRTKRK